MIRLQLLDDLDVPCAKWAASTTQGGVNETGFTHKAACTARYSWWLMQDATEAAGEVVAEAGQEKAGASSGCKATAASGTSCSPPPLPSPAAGVDGLFTGDLREDIPRLRVTIDWATQETRQGTDEASVSGALPVGWNCGTPV